MHHGAPPKRSLGLRPVLALLSLCMLVWVLVSHKTSLRAIQDVHFAAVHPHANRPDPAHERATSLLQQFSSASTAAPEAAVGASGNKQPGVGTAQTAAAGGPKAAAAPPQAEAGQQQQATQASYPKLPPSYNASAAIPQIIHQNFMGGPQQLLRHALRPLSHFRKEWWQSCKTHHPGWQYKLWDAAACEQLLRQQYPWFLDTWHKLGRMEHSTVLQSDAIRPFILHAQGGVYLDLDSECFSDMSPWLQGAQLVLQAETDTALNNAQMAGVAGHPLWAAMQRSIQARVTAGHKHPLKTTGPEVVTDMLRNMTGNLKGKLAGGYVLPGGSRVAVYGLGQFFTPCAWDDWGCAVNLARSKPLLRAKAAQAVAAAAEKAHRAAVAASANDTAGTATAAATGSGAAAAVVHQLPVMLAVPGIVGVHHFSGSWLKLDGSKSLSLRQEGQRAVLDMLFNGTGFMQQPCSQLKLLAAQQQQQQQQHSAAAAAVPVCWEAISAAAANRSCEVVSVRSLTTWAGAAAAAQKSAGSAAQQRVQQQQLLRLLAAELQLAAAGCSVKLVTDTPLDLSLLTAPTQQQQQQQKQQQQRPEPAAAIRNSSSSNSRSLSANSSRELLPSAAVLQRLKAVTAVLGVSPDPFASPPVHTLDSLVDTELQGSHRLTLLLLDLATQQQQQQHGSSTSGSGSGSGSSSTAGPAHATVLDVLNQQYVSSSAVLGRVDSVVLALPAAAAAAAEAHKAYGMYQHLVQEHGFVGYYHSAAASAAAAGGTPAAGAAGAAAGRSAAAAVGIAAAAGSAVERATAGGAAPGRPSHLPVMLGMSRLPARQQQQQ